MFAALVEKLVVVIDFGKVNHLRQERWMLVMMALKIQMVKVQMMQGL